MKYQIHTFPNGIRVVHSETNGSNIAHCGILINAGTRDEENDKEGIAHFIEHTLFKGTKKRSSNQILQRLETVGGELNAFTSKEETCIHASFLTNYYERAIELITDIVFNSTFPEKEIKKEQNVVMDEIHSYLDNPIEQIFDDFEGQIYKKHALGHPILGTIESVKGMGRKDILRFIQNNYHTNEIVLSSVGNISLDQLISISEKHLANIKTKNNTPKRKRFSGYKPTTVSINKETNQTHCIIGNVTYGYRSEKRTSIALLNNILGGPGMNSRLNLAIREKYGFTYNLESNYTTYSDTGLLSIYMGTEKDKLERTMELVYKELKKLKENKIPESKLKQAKQQIIGQISIAHEYKSNVMIAAGKNLLSFNKVEPTEYLFKKIEAVTSEDILERANELFDVNKMSTLIYEAK